MLTPELNFRHRRVTRWHRCVARLWALSLAGTLAGAAAQTPPTQKLRIVGGLAGVNQYVQHEEPFWAGRLSELSQGRFDAEIVPFDRAGVPAQDMLRLIRLGVIPFGTAQISRVAAQDAEFSAADLAGLNPDMATLKKTVAAFRPFLESSLRQRYGIELLAVYVYPAQMVFCNRPIRRLSDLSGQRVRVSGSTVADFIQAVGGVPVVTAMSDMVPQLRKGAVSCAVTGTMTGNTLGLHEITTHIYVMPITWGLSIFAANQDAWNALEPQLRILLRNELPKLEAQIWQASEKETADGLACNTGAPACRDGHKGKMVAAAMTPQDNSLRQEVLRARILPNWLRRCGASCADTWNHTIGPTHGLTLQGTP